MDYKGQGRSNYFKVKEPSEFRKWCREVGIKYACRGGRQFSVSATDDGDLPDTHPETGEDLNALEEILDRMADGQTLVWFHTGSEGMRYMNGCALALHKGKETMIVDLGTIYQLIQKQGWPLQSRAAY
ncbi:hypothetical protein UFOVP1492_14 [uncultured Caudovirales phage]|uniref:Uncharacterized protein n=1 Tax=uncultured Caudovirales phage TaxID=2100421 RepID=A0A6J7XL31_9CAUD|nr:hypothetical protein UFOVP1127_120 [uncultured Caudovirales phage]CAB4193494.1 hypothetical protein UFOVP1242_90 [uncultured Caudovirales phage]CAB4217186.1 hypothetical protein UFOVP1492_14 [uncultured Caudovirales phage]CAB5231247.1 hypothetical protein UFOVP1580_43 [uncultured Caudovirales phage]